MAPALLHYWAFLSYSHADQAAAVALHQGLERYRIPSHLRREQGLPQRLIPIFRDHDELEAAAGLSAKLEAALDQSRWLIVLCSPASARSRYVNREIEYFLQKHGRERILCALVEGEPPECFPPALLGAGDEPLAADFRPGADVAAGRLKLLAALAGVSYARLQDREAQRQRQRRLWLGGGVAALSAASLLAWDLYAREQVEYYANTVRREGIWQGLDRLSAEQAAQRAESYRYLRHGRLSPPFQVDFVNGSGSCASSGLDTALGDRLSPDAAQPTARLCRAVFTYTEDGRVETESLLNELGAVRETLTYTGPGLAQLTRQGFEAPSEGSGVRYLQFSRDASGLDTQVVFLHSRGSPRANRRGDYGHALGYDAADRLILRSRLDDQGKDTGEVQHLVYSEAGFLSEERLEDAAGQLREGPEGWAVQRYQLDAVGNVRRVDYLSASSTPVLTNEGFAGLQLDYDVRGNAQRTCFLDTQGQAVVPSLGYACTRTAYSKEGRPLRVDWTDPAGKPLVASGQATGYQLEYDAQGKVLRITYHDALDQPAIHRMGYASVRHEHDAHGNLVTQAFLDEQNQPADTALGSTLRLRFNEYDKITEYLSLDADGRPQVMTGRGFACARYAFDERGNILRADYLDADLKPVITTEGFAARELVYDDLGNRIEVRHLDTAGRLAADARGVAITRYRYDHAGRVAEETYLGEQQQPIALAGGGYGQRFQYDSRGQTLSRLWLDARGGVMEPHSP